MHLKNLFSSKLFLILIIILYIILLFLIYYKKLPWELLFIMTIIPVLPPF